MRMASLWPVGVLPQICTVWCTKLRKHFNAIIEVFHCFTVSPLRSACPGVHQTTMKTKGRQLQRACKKRWLSSEATLRGRNEILVVWAALKQLSESSCQKCVLFYCDLRQQNISTWCFPFVNIATSPDRTVQSFFRRDVLTLHRWILPQDCASISSLIPLLNQSLKFIAKSLIVNSGNL